MNISLFVSEGPGPKLQHEPRECDTNAQGWPSFNPSVFRSVYYASEDRVSSPCQFLETDACP